MACFRLPKSSSGVELEIHCTIPGPWSGALCTKIKPFRQNALIGMVPKGSGSSMVIELTNVHAHFITNQAAGKTLHFFNNCHSDQLKFNKWSEVWPFLKQ